MAELICEVIAETPNDYESSKGKQVHEHILSCIDRSSSRMRIKHAFDYVCTEEEEQRFKGKLMDKRIVLGINGFGEWMKTARLEGAILEVDGKPVNGSPVKG